MEIRQQFIEAINNGDLGSIDDSGVIVTLSELEQRFSSMEAASMQEFLPSIIIPDGQTRVTKQQFLFQLKDGVYRVHPDALDDFD